MTAFLLYLVKAALATALLYLVYPATIKGSTLHRAGRAYLLAAAAAGCLPDRRPDALVRPGHSGHSDCGTDRPVRRTQRGIPASGLLSRRRGLDGRPPAGRA